MTSPSNITTEQQPMSDAEQRIEEIRAKATQILVEAVKVSNGERNYYLNDHAAPGREIVGMLEALLEQVFSIPAQIKAAVEAERAKTKDLLAKCRVALGVAAFHDEGLDPTEADPLIEAIGQTIADSDDYNASLKSSDDMCERCGEGAIRHVIKMGYAKYDGVCDGCFNLDVAAIRSRGEAK